MDALTRLLPKSVRTAIARLVDPLMARCGYLRFNAKWSYVRDGLATLHNDSFRRDPQFQAAYARAVDAGQGVDAGIEWRIHVALWAAATALRVEGDFVECGVNAGFVSSAIMRRLDWANVPRKFYLIDTFRGPVLEQFSAEEQKKGRVDVVKDALARGAYVTDLERVRANFAEWPNAVVVPGVVPDVLATLAIEKVALLHIDLNCAYPECASLVHFWPRLTRGALVLLDDYAYWGHEFQKQQMDEAVRRLDAEVLALPTGQGLIVR